MWFPLPDSGPLSGTGSSLAGTLGGVDIQGTPDTARESRRGGDMITESQVLVSSVKKVVVVRGLGETETPHAETRGG